MKYKYNNQWKEMNFKVSDTLPIGSIIDYNGETAPTGWEEVDGLIESGTWTPVLQCRDNETAPTYTTRNVLAHYRKIGDLVYVEFYVRGNITQLNGTSNYIEIGGLPFTNHAAGFGQQALAIGVIYDLTSSDNNVNKTMCILGNKIAIQKNDGSGAAQYKVTTATYFEVGGSGWYIAES